MAWWRRKRKERDASQRPSVVKDGPQMQVDLGAVGEHARRFCADRRGVEAFIEPATNVSATTVILIAHDGEWTRRAVPSPEAARQLARNLQIPVYDVNLTGYPPRMREYNARRAKGL